jgi:hypothetical protein
MLLRRSPLRRRPLRRRPLRVRGMDFVDPRLGICFIC